MLDITDRPDDLIYLSEAAGLFPRRDGRKVHASTVWRRIRRGRLEGWKDDAGRWLVSRAAVLGLVRLVRTTPELTSARERRRQVEEAWRAVGGRPG